MTNKQRINKWLDDNPQAAQQLSDAFETETPVTLIWDDIKPHDFGHAQYKELFEVCDQRGIRKPNQKIYRKTTKVYPNKQSNSMHIEELELMKKVYKIGSPQVKMAIADDMHRLKLKKYDELERAFKLN